MKGSQFSLYFRHYLRRSLREPFTLMIYIALPVVISGVLNAIYTWNPSGSTSLNGYNMVATYISVGMMLLFQLSGGLYLLNYLYNDLMRPMKWRLKAAPGETAVIIYAAASCCTIFCALQGLLIVCLTAWLFNAYWGNLFVTVLTIFVVSIISQMLGMLLLLLTRSVGVSEGIVWALSNAMAALGGMLFPLPDNALFGFVKIYGTPFSLASSAIFESGFLKSTQNSPWIFVLILLGIAGTLCWIAIPLGRRRLV